jgi:hypothetical protein
MDKRYKESMLNILLVDDIEQKAYEIKPEISWNDSRDKIIMYLEQTISMLQERLKEIS